jgi:aminoglycoside phosphotransferase (APT) family kinase protein
MIMDLATKFAAKASLTDVVLAGEGLEFNVYRAKSAKYGETALRIPKLEIYENVNDPYLEAKSLLVQEFEVYRYLSSRGFPVPEPFELLELDDGQAATLTRYVEDDGTEPSPENMGSILGLLHSMPLPTDITFVSQEGTGSLIAVPRRIIRRWAEMKKFVSDLPDIPSQNDLEIIARGLERFPSCLLHLDMRDANVRVRCGKIVAVTDWSNSMLGPSAIDLYRVLELVHPPPEFLEGYQRYCALPVLTEREEAFLRLDAAVMLTLVFLSEAPDPNLAPTWIDRVEKLAGQLNRS